MGVVVISFDPSILISYYDAKAGILDSSTSGSSATSTAAAAPSPPWDAAKASSQPSALAQAALNGQNVINPNTALTDVTGASQQYNSLFTLYQGLNALSGLTSQMLSTTATTQSNRQASSAFETGLGQVMSYVNGLNLPNIRITNGSVSSSAATTLAPATENDTYTTGVIFQGDMNDAVPAFQGTVQFNINITGFEGAPTSVPIDLSQMGSTPRTMPNVVNYINAQLKAAGFTTRFATDMQAPTPQTLKVGGQTVTLPAGPDQWSFKINGDSAEQVSFSAPASAAAVYVAQISGDPNATTSSSAASSASADSPPVQQLVKLQTSNSTTSTAPPAAQSLPGTISPSPDEVQATTLPVQVGAVHATATAPDGSVYVVANVTGTVGGQVLQGSQDVALLKYDSTGKLLSASTLGATGSASGYSIAVSASGAVAVAGSVNGSLDAASSGSSAAAGTTQSFVSVFDSSGDLQWSQQNAGIGDNQANAVAFGSDGSVYIAGQTQGSLPGATGGGSGQSGYLEGFSATGTKLFTTQFGSTGTSKATALAVDGSNVVVGGVENGDGVLRSFTLNATGAPTAGATRDLGALGSGAVAGVAISNGQVIVAGTTSNGSLSAGAVTSSYSGGQDAFVAQLSENLSPSSSDAVAYYGGAGQDTATALSVVNGQVYIAGTSTGGLPGLTGPTNGAAAGTKEGYVANIDVATGQVQWSQALQGQNGYDTPESIAVSATGASVLDRLGLPDSTLQYTSSQTLTSATSVRPGDQFQVRTSAGGPLATVTIAAGETPQSLALKIRQATGFQANVTVTPSNGKEEVKITPENPQQVIELLPGPAGKDALAPLGLPAGVVQSGAALPTQTATPSINPGAPVKIPTDTYGLGLDQSFDLTTTAGIKAAQSAISTAMAKVQNAYYNLKTAGQPQTPSASASGTVPQYLTDQIASYKNALARLTGGSSSSSSSSSSTDYSPAGIAAQILA